MILRKAKPEDEKAISAVLVSAYNIQTQQEGIAVFHEETKKGHQYIVAEEDGKIVGLTTWLAHGLPKHMLAELDRIAVLPEAKGKGVAKQLFDQLVKDANAWYTQHGFKLRKLYILTHEDNPRAQKFYEKMGLKHETTLRKHYYDDKDEWVYSMFF